MSNFCCQSCTRTYADLSNIVRRNCCCSDYICFNCFYFSNIEKCRCGQKYIDAQVIKNQLKSLATWHYENTIKIFNYILINDWNYTTLEKNYMIFLINNKYHTDYKFW